MRPGPLRVLVSRACLVLAEAGVASPETDAVVLAAYTLGVDPAEVHRRMVLGEDVDAAFADRFDGLVEERAARIPLQHLTGTAHFRRLALAVGPGVFVPRPETEVVAGLAIEAVQKAAGAGRSPIVVDLCTGSGVIAFSVKDEVPGAQVVGVELSDLALAWATLNRDRLGLDVDLVRDDATTALAGWEGTVDVVVSNPPYIPVGATPVDVEVREHDPALALYGGSADGLAIPRAVAVRAAALLRPGGVLVMEHAEGQGADLARILAGISGWTEVADHPDLAGRPRAIVAHRTAAQG